MAQHAYAVTNKAAGLGAAAFTWSDASSTNRTYVNDGRMDKQFATTSILSGVNVIIDLGSAQAVTAVAVLNSNIATATGATLKVDAADSADFLTNPVTPKAVTTLVTTAPRQKDHVLQFASVSKRYWKLTWAWTGFHQLRIGELFLGQTTALTRFVSFGGREELEFIGSDFRSRTGETRGHYIAGPIRHRSLPFDDFSESERDELVTMWLATNGGRAALLWCEEYEAVSTAAAAAKQNCIYGKFDKMMWGWSEPDYLRFGPDRFTIRSLGREVGS